MLTQAVVDDVVKKLNDATDVPFIGEETEGVWIAKLVSLVDEHLPPWVVQFMASAADGLTTEELSIHENVITADLCKRVNMSKLLPDFVEEKIIRYAVRGILAYAKVGNQKP